MLRKSLSLLPIALILVTSSGCTTTVYTRSPEAARRAEWRAERRADRAAEAVGDMVSAAQATPAPWESSQQEIAAQTGSQREWLTDDGSPPTDEANVHPYVPLAAPVPASAADTRFDRAKPFDLGAAYGAIAHVDLGACEGQGLASGYGRVTLTFQTDGTPTDVGVALPDGSSPPARACVEAAFRTLRVAPFDGSAATVRRMFHVGEGATNKAS